MNLAASQVCGVWVTSTGCFHKTAVCHWIYEKLFVLYPSCVPTCFHSYYFFLFSAWTGRALHLSISRSSCLSWERLRCLTSQGRCEESRLCYALKTENYYYFLGVSGGTCSCWISCCWPLGALAHNLDSKCPSWVADEELGWFFSPGQAHREGWLRPGHKVRGESTWLIAAAAALELQLWAVSGCNKQCLYPSKLSGLFCKKIPLCTLPSPFLLSISSVKMPEAWSCFHGPYHSGK